MSRRPSRKPGIVLAFVNRQPKPFERLLRDIQRLAFVNPYAVMAIRQVVASELAKQAGGAR